MEGYLGEIRLFAGNFPPIEWEYCNGQILAARDYQALYSLIGCEFGGDCRDTFALPDLRGRKAIHPSMDGKSVSNEIGVAGGTEKVSLTLDNLPSHTHLLSGTVNVNLKIPCNTDIGILEEPDGAFFAKTNQEVYASEYADTTRLAPVNVNGDFDVIFEASGSGNAIDVREPYLALNYIICVSGIYPSFP